jgi:transcriptional regulator with XRE-family HTH domain
MAKKKEEATGLVEQLREAIRRSGQTLNQLSGVCGVGRDRLSRFLRGERDLTLSAAEQICRALGLRLTRGDEPPAEEKGKPKGKK